MKYRDTREGMAVKPLGTKREGTIQTKHDHLQVVDVLWHDTKEVEIRIKPSELDPIPIRNGHTIS